VRYYLGVDWADQTHAVWVVDERGTKVAVRTVPHTAEGLSEWGRELDGHQRAPPSQRRRSSDRMTSSLLP
jgi:transposase